MSLILEALRKSERQRRLGQTPDLYAPMPIARVSRRPRLLAWPLVALALAIGVGAAWWFTRDRDEEPARVADAATSGRGGDRPDNAPAARAPRAAPVAPSPAAREPATPPAAAAPPTVAAPEPPDNRTEPVARSPLTAPVPATLPPQAQPDPATASDPPPRTPAPATPPAPSPAATAAQGTPPPADDAPLSLSQLPAAEREALPPLQVSMHVYADIPTRRFAIIDGARVGEGAALGGGVTVVEIRRDGSVLDVNGRRVLLPRP